ncbi:hypothetical protein V8C26DRAFT_1640 [Trichoderma gracile]
MKDICCLFGLLPMCCAIWKDRHKNVMIAALPVDAITYLRKLSVFSFAGCLNFWLSTEGTLHAPITMQALAPIRHSVHGIDKTKCSKLVFPSRLFQPDQASKCISHLESEDQARSASHSLPQPEFGRLRAPLPKS